MLCDRFHFSRTATVWLRIVWKMHFEKRLEIVISLTLTIESVRFMSEREREKNIVNSRGNFKNATSVEFLSA